MVVGYAGRRDYRLIFSCFVLFLCHSCSLTVRASEYVLNINVKIEPYCFRMTLQQHYNYTLFTNSLFRCLLLWIILSVFIILIIILYWLYSIISFFIVCAVCSSLNSEVSWSCWHSTMLFWHDAFWQQTAHRIQKLKTKPGFINFSYLRVHNSNLGLPEWPVRHSHIAATAL